MSNAGEEDTGLRGMSSVLRCRIFKDFAEDSCLDAGDFENATVPTAP